MPYNSVAESFNMKKLCSRQNQLLYGKRPLCVFELLFWRVEVGRWWGNVRCYVRGSC